MQDKTELISVIRTDQSDFDSCWKRLREKLTLENVILGQPGRLEKVRDIIAQVRDHRDQALADLTAQYDQVQLDPSEFRVPAEQLEQAHQKMDPTLLGVLRQAIENVRDYQERIKVQPRPDWTRDGMRLGVRYRPVKRLGVCVPGASAPLLSTVIMTVVPAQVAGVKEIAVISSPAYQGTIHPSILGVCHELKVGEVYRVSGAHAVAALALGTPAIPRVDMIVGPGGWWGQLAKKELAGIVAIDSFAGPSEVLILADDSANPAWIAADMLSQTEHAPGSSVLVCTSGKIAEQVTEQLAIQLDRLDRKDQTRKFLREMSLIVIARDIEEVVALTNEFAPEHLQIQCRGADAVLERIENAGAIFVGYDTPVAVGDYFAGPSHTLPTGGSARIYGALNVNDFFKQISVIGYDQQTLKRHEAAITRLAREEGLGAHAESVSIRTRSKP